MRTGVRPTSFTRSVILPLTVAALAVVPTAPLNHPVLQAQSPQALEAQHQRLLPLFELDGVVFTDADETRGRFLVGVLNRGLETAIRARLQALGVSSSDVDVVATEPIVEMADLRSRVRPLVGGLQLRFDNFLCTLGFNAGLGAGHGFVVNSHCTTKESVVNATDYYQPLDQVSGDYIGQEIIDPPFFQKINGCPKGKVCRYSDAAYVQLASNLDPNTAADRGAIAKTAGVNNGSLVISGKFTITSELVGNATVNTVVNKVGRTTGWTQGRVTNTCANTGVSGSRIVRLCQDFVDAGVGGGDSSSPVFKITSGDNVQLYGILWGGDSAGTMFVYSPLSNVEDELGDLVTH
jgi:hypothetical protein